MVITMIVITFTITVIKMVMYSYTYTDNNDNRNIDKYNTIIEDHDCDYNFDNSNKDDYVFLYK